MMKQFTKLVFLAFISHSVLNNDGGRVVGSKSTHQSKKHILKIPASTFTNFIPDTVENVTAESRSPETVAKIYWRWFADKKSCDDYIDKGRKKTIKLCADQCAGETTAFVYGTNDFNTPKCNEQGCRCFCIKGDENGNCSSPYKNNAGYRYYKFGSYGSEYELAEEKKVCDFNTEDAVNKDFQTTLDDCAVACRNDGSMFIYGTEDWRSKQWHCKGGKCKCYCYKDANEDGTCATKANNGYRLYRYNQERYSINNGRECRESYAPLTKSAEKCAQAAKFLGFPEQLTSGVVVELNSAERPTGCFRSADGQFHFNKGTNNGNKHQDGDSILCIDRVRELAAMSGSSKTIQISDICTLNIRKSYCTFTITGTSCSMAEVQESLLHGFDIIQKSGGFVNKNFIFQNMKLVLSQSGTSCVMREGSKATLTFNQVEDSTYSHIYADYIPVKLGRKGLTVEWPVRDAQTSWKAVTITGDMICDDMTPNGSPVQFTVTKEKLYPNITLKSTSTKDTISVEKILSMFRLSTKSFTDGEANRLGFEGANIKEDQMEIVIIPNKALEIGISGKLSKFAGRFDPEENILLLVQHMEDDLVPSVALLQESVCKTITNIECIFPFTYSGTVHDTCAGSSPWCSYKVDANGVHIKGNYNTCKKTQSCNIGRNGLAYIIEETAKYHSQTPKIPQIDFLKDIYKFAQVISTSDIPNVNLPFLKEMMDQYACKDCDAAIKEGFNLYFNVTDKFKLLEGEPGSETSEPEETNFDESLKPVPTKPVITIQRLDKQKRSSLPIEDEQVASSGITSTGANELNIMASQSDVSASPANVAVTRNTLETRSEDENKQILMMVKFNKDHIKFYSTTRVKGKINTIKDFAMSRVETNGKAVPFAEGTSKLYFESLLVSATNASLKARSTTSKELIPHLLTLKDMTAVMIVKREGMQFKYDSVDFTGEGTQGILDRQVFVSLVEDKGESYVKGKLDYFNVYNITDQLQTDVISENYQTEFKAVKNISFINLEFRTKLSGDSVMRVYGEAETFGKGRNSDEKGVLVEGIVFMKDEDPKKHLALGFVAKDIKYGKMLESIYGNLMSNYPWVTMKEAAIIVSREKNHQITFEHPLLKDAYENAGKSKKEMSGCKYEPGDGISRARSYIGYALGRRDCAMKCFDKSRVDTDIDGATFDMVQKKWCWCQHVLTDYDTNDEKGEKLQTCKMDFVENHDGIYFSGKVGLPSSCQNAKEGGSDKYCRFFFDRLQNFDGVRIAGHLHPTVAVIKSDVVQEAHHLLDNRDNRNNVVLLESSVRVYKQNGIDEADVVGRLNLFNGLTSAGFDATISRGRMHGHLQVFLHTNGVSNLFQNGRIALEPAIGNAKIEDQKLSYIDFSQSSVYIGSPLPPRDETTHYADKESFKRRIGSRLKILQPVVDFDASDTSNNKMHGHLEGLTYKRLFEAFDVQSKVEEIDMFKDAKFSDVTFVAYARKKTFLPSKNETISKGLHILGELKVYLPEDVWERPADQPRHMTPSGEASNQFLFDLATDVEVKEDGLHWTIRMPRMNTSDGMLAIQACNVCTQAGPLLHMITPFDDQPMLPTFRFTGWVITVGYEFKITHADFNYHYDTYGKFFIREPNGLTYNTPASYFLKSDKSFKRFKMQLRFLEGATFKDIEVKFGEVVAKYQERQLEMVNRFSLWSNRTKDIITELQSDTVGSSTKQLLDQAKAMKKLEIRLRQIKKHLHKDCIEKCRLNNPVWVLNKPMAKIQDLQMQEMLSGTDWVINPACVAKCELDKIAAGKSANRMKKILRILKERFIKYALLSERIEVAVRSAKEIKEQIVTALASFKRQTRALTEYAESYRPGQVNVTQVNTYYIEMNEALRNNLPRLPLFIGFRVEGQSGIRKIREAPIYVNKEFERNVAKRILTELVPRVTSFYLHVTIAAVALGKIEDNAMTLLDMISEGADVIDNKLYLFDTDSKLPPNDARKKQRIERIFGVPRLNPMHQGVVDRVTKAIKIDLPTVSKYSYRTKVALTHYGPWAFPTLKANRGGQLYSINTTIPTGSPCQRSNAVVNRFADLVYEVDDVIKNYARHKVAMNNSQSSIMRELEDVKAQIDQMKESGDYTRSEMKEIQHWYKYSKYHMDKWIESSIAEFTQHNSSAISDHFKGVDGKVKSKFAKGTKGYVDYLCAVGRDFVNKLPKENSSCGSFAQGVSNLLEPHVSIEAAVDHVERLKRSMSDMQENVNQACR